MSKTIVTVVRILLVHDIMMMAMMIKWWYQNLVFQAGKSPKLVIGFYLEISWDSDINYFCHCKNMSSTTIYVFIGRPNEKPFSFHVFFLFHKLMISQHLQLQNFTPFISWSLSIYRNLFYLIYLNGKAEEKR